MRIEFHPTLAYTPRTAMRAFDPPVSERAIRRAIRFGRLKIVPVGSRIYIMRDELQRAAEAGEIK